MIRLRRSFGGRTVRCEYLFLTCGLFFSLGEAFLLTVVIVVVAATRSRRRNLGSEVLWYALRVSLEGTSSPVPCLPKRSSGAE